MLDSLRWEGMLPPKRSNLLISSISPCIPIRSILSRFEASFGPSDSSFWRHLRADKRRLVHRPNYSPKRALRTEPSRGLKLCKVLLTPAYPPPQLIQVFRRHKRVAAKPRSVPLRAALAFRTLLVVLVIIPVGIPVVPNSRCQKCVHYAWLE